MFRQKFINMINLPKEFSEDFRKELLDAYDNARGTASRINMISEMQSMLERKGYLQETDPVKKILNQK